MKNILDLRWLLYRSSYQVVPTSPSPLPPSLPPSLSLPLSLILTLYFFFVKAVKNYESVKCSTSNVSINLHKINSAWNNDKKKEAAYTDSRLGCVMNSPVPWSKAPLRKDDNKHLFFVAAISHSLGTVQWTCTCALHSGAFWVTTAPLLASGNPHCRSTERVYYLHLVEMTFMFSPNISNHSEKQAVMECFILACKEHGHLKSER